MKKTLPISIWLALIATVSMRGVANVLFSQHLDTAQQGNNDAAFREISTNISLWNDPAWQRTMDSKLLAMKVVVVIQDAAGHTIYSSNPAFIASPAKSAQMIVDMQGTHQQRVAFLYKSEVGASEIQQIIETGAILLFVVLIGAAWFIGRMILHPLQKITYAARQIANNNLECYLPRSSVREIANFSCAFGVMRDALRASLERQAEMEQERCLFISTIAHDLRTPLFALRGYLEGLANGLANTPEKTSKYIGICKEKADLLARLVADLFAYTQLEYLEQKPHFERLELGSLWKQTAEGFLVKTAHDSKEALKILEATPVDCLLLDVKLPGISGFELCRRIRKNSNIPILYLSASDNAMDKVRGLGLGGDDYIVKSVIPSEVVARLKAVLQRYHLGANSASHEVLDFGRLTIDLRAHEVRVNGTSVPFPAREFALLRLLAENPRQVFTHEQLFERFWGDIGDRHTVVVHIGRIREKIEVDPTQPHYIVTVRGIGYRFESQFEKG